MRGRRELALMSDRSLRDIGLTRYDAFQEIRKPLAPIEGSCPSGLIASVLRIEC